MKTVVWISIIIGVWVFLGIASSAAIDGGERGRIFIFGFIASGLGTLVLAGGFRKYRLKSTIQNLPTSKIRSIAMGLVEVKGKVKEYQKTLKSPMSKKDCVYCMYSVEEWKKTGKNSEGWVSIASGREDIPFYVEDKTGKVLVDPEGAEIDLPVAYEYQTGWGKVPKNIQEFCESHNIKRKMIFINKKLRFREWTLVQGQTLFVLGNADDNPYMKEATAVEGVQDVMIQKGGPFFYISDKDETKVLRKLKTYSILSIIAGAALLVIGPITIFISLGLL